MLFQIRKILICLRNTIKYILDEFREACDCPIDCQVTLIVKVQKSMKSNVKIVHLSSVVQSEWYVATKILFENKIKMTTLFLGLDSVIYLAVNGTVTSLPVFLQNILNCVTKTKEAFTGLERHGFSVKLI